MDKLKILQWVAAHMPVEVDGKTKGYLHTAGLLDDAGKYCMVCDADPYDQLLSEHEVKVTPTQTERVTLLM